MDRNYVSKENSIDWLYLNLSKLSKSYQVHFFNQSNANQISWKYFLGIKYIKTKIIIKDGIKKRYQMGHKIIDTMVLYIPTYID